MITLTIYVGERLFAFDSFEQWVDTATDRYAKCGCQLHYTVAVDHYGRICNSGRQFMRARDDGTFPVTVYRIDEEVPRG